MTGRPRMRASASRPASPRGRASITISGVGAVRDIVRLLAPGRLIVLVNLAARATAGKLPTEPAEERFLTQNPTPLPHPLHPPGLPRLIEPRQGLTKRRDEPAIPANDRSRQPDGQPGQMRCQAKAAEVLPGEQERVARGEPVAAGLAERGAK